MKNPNDIPTICALQKIRCKDSGEPLVDLEKTCPDILCNYRRKDSELDRVLVRRTITDKLQKVQMRLVKQNPDMRLLVVEGHRSPAYQERYFLKQLLLQYKKDPAVDFDLLLESVHQWVALPTIAGHPTGGAVDLTLALHGKEIEMGGNIADFSNPKQLPTYSPTITSGQAQNRLLLHDLMISEGFAPFYGEWWHFSYGDLEWAAFYGLSGALYSPIF
jgi:zinc D-Ala-D-Ala dipeptidase